MPKVTTSELSAGRLARAGLLPPERIERALGVIERAARDGLETIRLVTPDQHGVLRGKTIVASALEAAFASGVTAPSTLLFKDTAQRTAFPVWNADAGFGRGALTGSGDFLLAPDPTTFRVLPWSPRSGWMLCDAAETDGRPIGFSSRAVLDRAIARLSAAGYRMVAGLEVEFHVFRLSDPMARPEDAGMPPRPPDVELLTRGFELLGEARYDALEPVMDAIRSAALELELPVRGVEAEFGPSQLEFVFDPGGPMAQADGMVLFRSMAKQVCARRGLHASFMCRPKLGGASLAASGWHLHQSVIEENSGRNVFIRDAAGGLSAAASGWIAGLLDHAAESCLMTTPTVNGYRRFQAYQLAPNRIQWAEDNRGAMIRALMRPGDPASRIENRVAEPAANPYFALASQILGGLSGVTRGLSAPPPSETPYDDDAPRLPGALVDAIDAFEASALFREALGEDFVRYYGQLKRAEWDRFIGALSEWEQAEYFSLL